MMLLTPVGLQSLAQADIQFSQLRTLAWGKGNTTITYTYDDNGSAETKVVDDGDTKTFTYVYNLQNRLAKVTKTIQGSTIAEITEYKYNPQGIRVEKHTWSEDDGTPQNDDVTVVYLVDAYNHTGYTQVLEELVFNKANPDPLTETPDSRKTYTIGDDVITQYENGTGAEYLLYDGHGSTRQLVQSNGTTITDSYSYDGYGVMLGGNPGSASNPSDPSTHLLYAGEQFDTSLQMYYNRARYYDQNIGRFNRIDPYAGNNQDPQSLHKYLYVHNNPVMNIDPSGMFGFSIAGLTFNLNMQMVIRTIDLGWHYWQYKKVRKTLEILAIASVIGSAFISDIIGSDYIDGAVQLELPFNKHPLLGWMPNMEFSYKNTTAGRVIDLDFSYEKKDPYGEGWNNLGLVAAGNFTFNLDTGTFKGSAIGLGFEQIFYKKYPTELSIKAKAKLPRALEFGLGVKFSSGWDPLSLGVGLSIFQWTPSGFEMLWGINWND